MNLVSNNECLKKHEFSRYIEEGMGNSLSKKAKTKLMPEMSITQDDMVEYAMQLHQQQ